MDAKTVKSSQTTFTELMIPSYANFGGKVHGGILLSLMDKVAYVTATKHSGAYCVTVSVDDVEFKEPVEVGDLISMAASVNYVGNSSMIVGIRVTSLNPKTNVEKHTNSCYFTMVAKDDDGKPTQVPKLILEEPVEVRRFYDAKNLKAMRSEIKKMLGKEVKDISFEEMKATLTENRCDIKI
ncbi:MAG: acyl-CoA thioesterase [Putridiphycobacter sp.]